MGFPYTADSSWDPFTILDTTSDTGKSSNIALTTSQIKLKNKVYTSNVVSLLYAFHLDSTSQISIPELVFPSKCSPSLRAIQHRSCIVRFTLGQNSWLQQAAVSCMKSLAAASVPLCQLIVSLVDN